MRNQLKLVCLRLYHITKRFPEGVTATVAVTVALDTKENMAWQGRAVESNPNLMCVGPSEVGVLLTPSHPIHAMPCHGDGMSLALVGDRLRGRVKKGRGWL